MSLNSETFSIQLHGGPLTIDMLSYPRLLVADKKELNNFKVFDSAIIEWPDLDEQLSIRQIKENKPSKETAHSFVKWLRKREI